MGHSMQISLDLSEIYRYLKSILALHLELYNLIWAREMFYKKLSTLLIVYEIFNRVCIMVSEVDDKLTFASDCMSLNILRFGFLSCGFLNYLQFAMFERIFCFVFICQNLLFSIGYL